MSSLAHTKKWRKAVVSSYTGFSRRWGNYPYKEEGKEDGNFQNTVAVVCFGYYMNNAEISRAFGRIALVLQLKGDENPFRIRAYERVALMLEGFPTDLGTLYKAEGLKGLQGVAGIGKDLALKIEEMLQTGQLSYLRELESTLPPGLLQMMEIEGLGPKKIKQLHDEFKVSTLEDLKLLAGSGKLETLKGWGKKSAENVLRGIEQYGMRSGRLPRHAAEPLVDEILKALTATGLCGMLEPAGSFRRGRETVGDLDFLATSSDPKKLMDAFCTLPFVDSVKAKGPTKSTVFLAAGLDADLRVVEPDVFGAALLYFTGSKDHNVRIRKMGIARNLTLSEYGLYKGTAAKKGALVAARTEEHVYKAIGLPWIAPELREDRGEIDAALGGTLPTLLQAADIRADLHMHSDFSDGSASMQEMITEAKRRGFAYVAITDHASAMGMVRGIKREGPTLKQYLKRVEAARRAVPGIGVLTGVEVDIQKDGSLYLPDAALKQFDWVIGSVHQHFHESREHATARLLKALDNPYLRVLGHPTARLLEKRPGIVYDMEAVLHKARDKGVAVELNASPERLDLSDQHLKRAKELGVKVSIGSDAHAPEGMDHRYGLVQARRGWLEPSDVLNTLSWKEFQRWLQKH